MPRSPPRASGSPSTSSPRTGSSTRRDGPWSRACRTSACPGSAGFASAAVSSCRWTRRTPRPLAASWTSWPGSCSATPSSSSTRSSRSVPSRRRVRRPVGERPGRRRRLPGLELRHGHGLGADPGRRRAGRAVARGRRPPGRGRGRPARRLRLRRLPPSRRDRPLQPGHASRCRLRGRWRPRARDLQRLPGPRRGRPPPGRAPPQPIPAVRVSGRGDSRRAHRYGLHAPGSRGLPSPDAGRPRRGLLLRRRGDARRAGAGRPGPLPIRRRGRVAGRCRGSGEPERVAPGDRRRHQCRRERGRPHATSGAGRRRAARVGRRDARPAVPRRIGGDVRRGGRGVTADLAQAVVPAPLHRALGLTDEELRAIEAKLGRVPNDLELAMFSVMWSEHCSYKSSRPLLRTLPTGGPDVVAGPGENAGVMRIGDGWAVAFKIESHNHPSAVEPYQGAATGVGGILRDIFAMGARPIAVLDALRFGDPADARTRHLLRGIVAGVGGYGNCVGVPTVGGELVFDPSYTGNPLVNVMAIGLLPAGRLTLAQAPGPGNLAILFGSTTGRDGIGGASVLASATFGAQDPSKRPAVQVGDPFAEKLLIEATLEILAAGLAEGLQDLGAAGITCGVSETADRAGTGIRVDLDAIPRREAGMAPFEVLISESQERMVVIARPERLPEIAAICARWGIPCAVIGRVTGDGDIAVIEGGLAADGAPGFGAP